MNNSRIEDLRVGQIVFYEDEPYTIISIYGGGINEVFIENEKTKKLDPLTVEISEISTIPPNYSKVCDTCNHIRALLEE